MTHHHKHHQDEKHKHHEENETQDQTETKAEKKENKESHELEKKVKELESKVKEYEDLLKRKMADFDNFRKRAQQEKERMVELASEQVILDFLPVYDNINRAVLSAEKNHDLKAFLEGVVSIENIFLATLSKYSIIKVDAVGQEFDPKTQHALYSTEGDYEKNTVIEELEKAFVKNEKALRIAKVVVGTPKKKETELKEQENKNENE